MCSVHHTTLPCLHLPSELIRTRAPHARAQEPLLLHLQVTCQKPSKSAETGEPTKNLKVWEVATGEVRVGHTLRQVRMVRPRILRRS